MVEKAALKYLGDSHDCINITSVSLPWLNHLSGSIVVCKQKGIRGVSLSPKCLCKYTDGDST